MCRKQVFIGTALLAGGAGMLLSLLLGSVFLSILFAAGLIGGGVLVFGGGA